MKKEDLFIIAKELGEEVDETCIVVDLKKIIENCDTYKNDLDFVKDFIITTVNDSVFVHEVS